MPRNGDVGQKPAGEPNTDNGFVVETKKKTTFVERKLPIEPVLLKRSVPKLLQLFVVFGLIVMALILGLGYWYGSQLAKAAGTPLGEIIGEARASMREDAFVDQEEVHLLIAGLDEIQKQREGSQLTDTLMITSIKRTGDVSLLSIPRDLWIEALKTKINALYYYGEESEETDGKTLLATVVEEISGVKIAYVLMLSLDAVQELIDVLGGIDVVVERSFTDELYPRDDVDPSIGDPELLYKTVSFTEGLNHFDGETAVIFMRSRQSKDEVEGSDEGRRARQQLIIRSLLGAVRDSQAWFDPVKTGQLYRLWKTHMEKDLPLINMAQIAVHMETLDVRIKSYHMPIQTNDDEGILIINPKNAMDQWVYEPVDPTFTQMKEWILSNL